MTPFTAPGAGGSMEEMIEQAVEVVALASMARSFGQMRGLEADDGRLDFFRMLDWLVEIERGHGHVDETTMSEEGRNWLLAKALGQTLASAVNSIVDIAASSHGMAMLRDASAKRSVLMSQNLNFANELYGIFSDYDKTEEMVGNR